MKEFFRAVEEGNEEEVIRLLDADPALLEIEDHVGHRPLTLASLYGRLGVVTQLIARGSNIHATGVGGITALDSAARGGNEEVVAFLLREGAHANARGDYGMTPLMWACDNGHLGAVKMLVQHMGGQGLDERSDRRWTGLHYASYAGHEEVVRFLLFAGADLSITDEEGMTPRAIAEENDRSEMIREGRARCMPVLQVRPPVY
jgi:ankyrin repeat protein